MLPTVPLRREQVADLARGRSDFQRSPLQGNGPLAVSSGIVIVVAESPQRGATRSGRAGSEQSVEQLILRSFTNMNNIANSELLMIHGKPRKRRGVATVELALCLPIIVLLVVGAIEACSMIFLKQSLAIAAYEGARTALIPNATAIQVQAACQQILKDRKVVGATVTVKPLDIAALIPGEMIDVTVSAPCSINTVVPNEFYRGKTLTTSASMMVEF